MNKFLAGAAAAAAIAGSLAATAAPAGAAPQVWSLTVVHIDGDGGRESACPSTPAGAWRIVTDFRNGVPRPGLTTCSGVYHTRASAEYMASWLGAHRPFTRYLGVDGPDVAD